MQGVANVSFLAMFVMYLLAALFGYLTFHGKHTTHLKILHLLQILTHTHTHCRIK